MKRRLTKEERGGVISESRIKRGLTQEELADQLGVDTGTVSRWENGSQGMRSRNMGAVARVLEIGLELLQFAIDDDTGGDRHEDQRDLRTVDLVAWLAESSGRPFGATYGSVASMADYFESESVASRHERSYERASIGRQDLATATADYYRLEDEDLGFYTAEVDGRRLTLTIVVRDSWLDLDFDLRNELGVGALASHSSSASPPMPEPVHDAGVVRLADAEVHNKVLVNNPMYRLLSADIGPNALDLTFSLASFADYALRNGLMELETIDALVDSPDKRLSKSSHTPVRDSLLPSLGAALDLTGYYCTGGPVSLFAAARPATDDRPADYALLVQQRGQHVMDIPGKLSTIPKGWHQPIGEAASEARLGTTLLRELEEELLGREDLEQMSDDSRRAADPLHSQRHAEALLPLLASDDDFHLRCTGFGLNLLSGTYEVPCLIVIDDETWWGKWAHLIAGNWETMSIEVVSSADTDGLSSLIHDPRWSNEGLFALIEGLRCLTRVGDEQRIAAPPIKVEAGSRGPFGS